MKAISDTHEKKNAASKGICSLDMIHLKNEFLFILFKFNSGLQKCCKSSDLSMCLRPRNLSVLILLPA